MLCIVRELKEKVLQFMPLSIWSCFEWVVKRVSTRKRWAEESAESLKFVRTTSDVLNISYVGWQIKSTWASFLDGLLYNRMQWKNVSSQEMSQALSSSICSTASGECRSVFLQEQHLRSELNCAGGFNMSWRRANHNLMILLVFKMMKSII